MSTSVVFMGTPEFAVPILQSLIDNPEYDVQAVLTQPDHHIGRKRTLHQSPVKELAEQYNIEVLQPAKLSNLIDAKVRGLRPAPLGNMVIDGLRTKIYDVTPLEEKTDLEPGKVVRVTKHQLVIAAGDGTTYQINKLKPAGKKAMDITSYLNGHKDITEGGQVVSED